MKIFAVMISFVFLILLSACEKPADIKSPNQYAKHGISFNYPSNWDLMEEDLIEDVTNVSVESPGSAIFMLQIFDEEHAISLGEFAQWYSKEANELIPIGKVTSDPLVTVSKKIHSVETSGKKELFTITLLGQKVPHQREFYILEQSGKVLYLISQMALEDQKVVDPGFDLIFKSFSVN